MAHLHGGAAVTAALAVSPNHVRRFERHSEMACVASKGLLDLGMIACSVYGLALVAARDIVRSREGGKREECNHDCEV